MQTPGNNYPAMRSMAVPHLNVTLILPDPTPNVTWSGLQYHQNLLLSCVTHVPSFHRIL